MTETEIEKLVLEQKEFFKTGATMNVSFRKEKLQELKECIKNNIDEISNALFLDLGKSASESYMAEIGMVLEEISCFVKNIAKWSRPKRVATPLAQFCATSFKKPSPKGTTVILSPWNYPFLLALSPLVDSIGAGNTVILKPSSTSTNTSQIIEKIIKTVFEKEHAFVILAGHDETNFLLSQKVDHIFFTGSPRIGKQVMSFAAKNLVPVTLELGGKSPCIVDETANIKLSAKRIVFGKFLNCGQTCIAPDFVLCSEKIKDELVENLKIEIVKQFGALPLSTPHFGKIINAHHFNRLKNLIETHNVIFGGSTQKHTNKISPTLVDATFESEIMKDEIFGPILPIVTFDSFENAVEKLKNQESPLATYVFSKNKTNIENITTNINFGGGCINDTIIHIASTKLSFGGVGNSGMGSYHGFNGFQTFSHSKSIVNKKLFLDLPFRYAPYSKIKDAAIKLFLK